MGVRVWRRGEGGESGGEDEDNRVNLTGACRRWLLLRLRVRFRVRVRGRVRGRLRDRIMVRVGTRMRVLRRR